MAIKQHLKINKSVLKDRVNRYAVLGLIISLTTIFIATILVAYQMTGVIDFHSMTLAHKSNPALWALDLTPFMFAYWGQSFCYELANTMESMLEDRTKAFLSKSGDLESKLNYETNHDYLTKLPNQRLLAQRISEGMKNLAKGETLAVILLHINDFREINYKYGTFNANNILIQFSERLKTVLLEPYLLQAYMGMNMVARLQGAEFVFLLPRLRDAHQLSHILDKLIQATSVNFLVEGHKINLKTTAGVAIYPIHGEDEAVLTRRAHFSLLQAEKEGKSYAVYDTSMDQSPNEARTAVQSVKELEAAIDNEEMSVRYSPIQNLSSGDIVGVEAMVQFDNKTYDLLNGEGLLPVVQGTSLSKKLTVFLFKTAIAQLAVWHAAGYKLFLTLSVWEGEDRDLPEYVSALLKEFALEPHYLKIQLTEKACLSDQARSISVLNQFAELGITIMISDFCSGYASFTYLMSFPIREVKIDQSFILSMMEDKEKLVLVKAVSQLAQALEVTLSANAIPNQEAKALLASFGYHFGEGPYLSTALSVSQTTTFLETSLPS